MSERLHKLLAQHGFVSRREIEKWILAGRVQLNGQPAQVGDQYRQGDRVIVDGRDITARLRAVPARAAVLAYHKPQGQPVAAQADEAAATDETVMERLPAVRGSRWLVINTMQPGDSGLLLLTSDGRLADALRRRAERIASAYVARVLVPTPEFDAGTLPRMVQFNDQPVAFDSIEPVGGEGTNRWFRVEAAHSHRRAAVRALFETQGLKVSRVMQVKFADMELPRGLPRGKHQALSEAEVAQLYAVAELEQPVVERPPSRAPRRAADRQQKKSPHRSGHSPAARDRDVKSAGAPTKSRRVSPRGQGAGNGKGRGPGRGRSTGNRRSGR